MSKHYRLVALAVVLAVICAAAWFVIDMRRTRQATRAQAEELLRTARDDARQEKARREAEAYDKESRELELKAKPWLKLLPEKTP